MKISRRALLAGSAALALAPKAEAWFPHGSGGGPVIGHGWNNLPAGAGGFVTGFFIANDNSIYCRTDVGGVYRWSGKTTTTTNPSDKWVQLTNLASLAGITSTPHTTNGAWGALEIVCAPQDAMKVWMLFSDVLGGAYMTIYYSTDSGGTWLASNLSSVANTSPNDPPYNKYVYYRIAVDPNNANVVYAGMPPSSGKSSGVYTTLVKAGGSDGHTFAQAYTDSGNTSAFPQTTSGAGACGMCFDPSAGTTTLGGQTVTKRMLMPVGGVDIYETVDGGNTWVSTGAATAFGTAAFSAACGVINSNGIYYIAAIGAGIWRYTGNGTAGGGTWYKILTNVQVPLANVPAAVMVVDPTDPTYLSVSWNGLCYGYTSTNADTGTPPTVTGNSFPNANLTYTGPSYDLPWTTYLFGQGHGFAELPCAAMDSAGNTVTCGNQSIWILNSRLNYTSNPTIPLVSFGRGQEAIVAQEAWRPTGGTYALLGTQDLGGVLLGGTYTTYPTDLQVRSAEWVCTSIEESPTDGTFVVARITTQGASGDGSGYSTNSGLPGSWTTYATDPATGMTTSATGGTGGVSSTTLTITAIASGPKPFPGQNVNGGNFIDALGTVNPDGTGTYTLYSAMTIADGTSLTLLPSINGGQIICVDNNHQIILANGFSHGAVPVVTANKGSTWAACNGAPSREYWFSQPWSFGPTYKPLAAGFGSDIGTVWLAAKTGSSTVTIYKSTDYGANFSATANPITDASFTPAMTGFWLLAVPGYTGHLWFCQKRTGGFSYNLWHSTDSGDNWASVAGPLQQSKYMSIGAIDPVSGTYPTLWVVCNTVGDYSGSLYFSIDGGATFNPLGSHGTVNGNRADLPGVQQLYGIGAVRADRQIFKRLYVCCGSMSFAYYNP